VNNFRTIGTFRVITSKEVVTNSGRKEEKTPFI